MSALPSRAPPPFRCVLVANRGEIAVRVVRTLKALGIRAVVTASDADLPGLAAREADAVERLGPPAPAASYLRVDAVVDAARRAGAEAVHPGYGFLSERHDLAAACEAAGLAFVGPPAAVLAGSSDKLEVKAKVAAAGVPVIPGPLAPVRVEGDRLEAEALARAARETGYPLLVKAIGGGGGRGLRVVRDAAGLLDAAESARREAAGAFGDARLYLEALLVGARHVEVQILCDATGRVAVLGDRDCSLQRRHQKVIEEAPAPGLSPATRRALHDAARRAAAALSYRNAGTVEFLVDREGRPHFLEVNRRLQVEHPVTEAVLGIDLVAWQLRVAAGEALPEGDGWVVRGHAVEARVCAEDPARDFLPGSGRLRRVVLPSGPGVRVDAGFATGDEVPPYYDSLLMKVIAHGETRDEALSRLDAALAATTVLGVPTNVAWLRRLLGDDDVRAGRLSTALLDVASSRAAPEAGSGAAAGADVALLAALGAELLGVDPVRTSGARAASGATAHDPWDDLAEFRLGAPGGRS